MQRAARGWKPQASLPTHPHTPCIDQSQNDVRRCRCIAMTPLASRSAPLGWVCRSRCAGRRRMAARAFRPALSTPPVCFPRTTRNMMVGLLRGGTWEAATETQPNKQAERNKSVLQTVCAENYSNECMHDSTISINPIEQVCHLSGSNNTVAFQGQHRPARGALLASHSCVAHLPSDQLPHPHHEARTHLPHRTGVHRRGRRR